MSKTLYDKLWDTHVVCEQADGSTLLYIDRHLLHEVTSPQAFAGLKLAGRSIWRLDANVAVPDHNVPTTLNRQHIEDPDSRLQVETLVQNCRDFNVDLIELNDSRQGIVHVIGPEQGYTLPGMTIVCGDSHTSTHGAFATISMGIGTSEVEHVLATQCLVQKKYKNMRISIANKLHSALSAKDIILYIIGQIGTAGATGYTIEYTGAAIQNLSMEARMTICNMSIEAGARCGLIAVDEVTVEYLRDKPKSPKGAQWQEAVEYWKTLTSDVDAKFDQEINIDASDISPQVTWGTSPGMVASVLDKIPDPMQENNQVKRTHMQHALQYMDLKPGTPITDIKPSHVFIGSCTNSRIEDLRIAAKVVAGKKVSNSIKQALVVPGSGLIKEQAEAEGLDRIFTAAGFEWRAAGCSMCLGMNPDKISLGDRCASTSNRNFEGRQGPGGRTHLVSPAMAAATAIHGHFVDIREVE